jgi:magnesium-transporting ATPase (P-type)
MYIYRDKESCRRCLCGRFRAPLQWSRTQISSYWRCHGEKGTEIAKSAADLILVDDLSKMIVAVAAGRRIYTNLKSSAVYCFYSYSYYINRFLTFWVGYPDILLLFMLFF